MDLYISPERSIMLRKDAELQLDQLQKLKSQYERESSELEHQRKELKASGNLQHFNEFVRKEKDLHIKTQKLEHEIRSIQLQINIHNKNGAATTHERIIIGAGVAGTAVFNEIPTQMRKSEHAGIPDVLVLNNPHHPNQWPKDGNTLMGQQAEAQTQIFSCRSYDFAHGIPTERNPYVYTMADDFTNAQIVTQNDMDMSVLNLEAIALEHKDTAANWEHPEYPHRVVVMLDGKKQFLYAKHIDICMGPGPSRKLTDRQISPDLAQKLQQDHYLVYGQDKGDAACRGKVVFYGGGAKNATMIIDLLLTKASAEIIWSARSGSEFDRNKELSRMYHNLDTLHGKTVNMSTGTLSKVEQLPSGKLLLTYTAPEKKGSRSFPELTGKTIECDQLVLGIGQDPHPLLKNLKGFIPVVYDDKHHHIPVGTCSKDKSIIIWGAAGSTGIGLTRDEQVRFIADTTAHAYTLPSETHANPSIYRSTWAIKHMAQALRKDKVFPENRHAHCMDLPDINLVTRGEFVTLLSALDNSMTLDQCTQIANKLIEKRSMQPRGIESDAELKGIVPDKLLREFSQQFFPFHEQPVQHDRRKVEPLHQHGLFKKPDAKANNQRLLSIVDRNEDANSFIAIDRSINQPSQVAPDPQQAAVATPVRVIN